MAARVENYQNMIEGIEAFCNAIDSVGGEMWSAIDICEENCEEDENVIANAAKAKQCLSRVAELKNAALQLAQDMQEEIDDYIRANDGE